MLAPAALCERRRTGGALICSRKMSPIAGVEYLVFERTGMHAAMEGKGERSSVPPSVSGREIQTMDRRSGRTHSRERIQDHQEEGSDPRRLRII